MPCCKCTTKSPTLKSVKSISSAERVAAAWGDLSRRGRCVRVRPKISESVTTTSLADSTRNPRDTLPSIRTGLAPALRLAKPYSIHNSSNRCNSPSVPQTVQTV